MNDYEMEMGTKLPLNADAVHKAYMAHLERTGGFWSRKGRDDFARALLEYVKSEQDAREAPAPPSPAPVATAAPAERAAPDAPPRSEPEPNE